MVFLQVMWATLKPGESKSEQKVKGGGEESSPVQMWLCDVTSPVIVAVDLGDFLHYEKYPPIVETQAYHYCALHLWWLNQA